jgi:alpha-L-fucosidase
MFNRTTISLLLVFTVMTVGALAQTPNPRYEPDFASLEKATPVPEWFKDAKFGIYCHWGVYSVPAFANEWYPRNMYMRGSMENKHHTEVYGDPDVWPYDNFMTGAKDKRGNFVQFAPKLKSAGGQFDPGEWAQLFADAGARFAGIVAEHHDGFSMWASTVNPWNAKEMGPRLDLVNLLTDAIRKQNLRVILSLHHAYNITGYYSAVPPTNDLKRQMLFGQQGKEKNEAFWLAKHKEIIDRYKPDIIYQDFNLHLISQPVLLQFLAYYYNMAAGWQKDVVATFKDGLNTRCAVLDYERGGPADITDYYWLTDDAISSSSWCYTEGIGYYSKKQTLHCLLDRVSKNGNLLLNISPKADGSIPQEQQDVLRAMGAWLRTYGEAVYATRAWEKFGEGPTKMGAGFGVMGAPPEGTVGDVRYTRSKDNTTLYAILLGWEKGQKEALLTSLSSNRITCGNLKSVELITGQGGKSLALTFKQDAAGLHVALPDQRPSEELAYVLKLRFDGAIPKLDLYVDVSCAPHYHLVPQGIAGNVVLGSGVTLSGDRKASANQWRLESAGKGFYKILNRENAGKVLACGASGHDLVLAKSTGQENEVWRFDDAHAGLVRISNMKFPDAVIGVGATPAGANEVVLRSLADGQKSSWALEEVCEQQQKPFKPNTIPGTIEAEDFDEGCPGEAYNESDKINEGGQYRSGLGVDIEQCSAGGYNVGWTHAGEWLAYTVNIRKSGSYTASFYVASAYDSGKLHLECDGIDKTGPIVVPNTLGFQLWQVLKNTVHLDEGQHVLRVVIDGSLLNFDKVHFEEVQ